MSAPLGRLMLVVDRAGCAGRDPVDVVAAAVDGGVGIVQVREREASDLVAALVDAVRRHAVLVVNGDPAVAQAHGCGVHLPAAFDADVGHARPRGASAHDAAEVDRALARSVDWVVAGTIYETDSKPGLAGRGLEHLASLVRRAHPTPVFAIGGITPVRARACRLAGAHGVAVRSGILAAADPRAAAAAYFAAL